MKSLRRLAALGFVLMFLSTNVFAQNKDWLRKMQDPNVNFWDVQNEFNEYWKNRSDYKSNGYKVFKRWEYINELRAAPDGSLQTSDEVMLEYERYMAEAPQSRSASGTWSLIGPLGYPSNNTGQPTGKGRVNTIAFHPSEPNTIFLGSPSGGIWKSANDGANWVNLSSNMPYLGVSAILIHPTDPDIIYIGTGDRDGDDAPGIGVYKSTDGGGTWFPANTGMGNTTVGMMLMHPADPNTILACTHDGIFKTTDRGTTWSLVQSGDFRDIKFKPGDPNIVYATEIAEPALFWRSTDNGDNWSVVTTPTTGVGSRMVIGVTPADPAVVYLVQIDDVDDIFKALLRSDDSGMTFAEQSNSPNILGYNCDGSGTASQATYDLCIAIDPSDADIVYVGGINSWKSVDGGASWDPVTHWVGSFHAPLDQTVNCAASVHADHHYYIWSPYHSPTRLYLGHDGGISYTDDGGDTWVEISNDMATGQIYKIGQSAHTAGAVSAGFQDNGVSATNNGGGSFTTIGGGDGTECVIDYSDSDICYRASQNGNVGRSFGGLFGSYSSAFISSLTDKVAFVAPYMLHRTVPTTMFLGRENLWRSTNVTSISSSSVVWEKISAFSPAEHTIRVMEQSPADLNIMYVSRSFGASELYRTDNLNAAAASVTWTQITKPGGYTVSDIKAHPTDPNIVYATANRFVYKSTNKGLTWTNISGNLPSLFINCLILDRDANEGIYVGNQTGIWYKDASISEWMLFSSGLPPVDVRELEIYYDTDPENSRITAATYGRGVWQSDLAVVNVVNPSNITTTSVSTSQIDLTWLLNVSGNNVMIATSPTTTFGVPTDGTAYTAGNPLPGGGTVLYVGNLTNFSHTGLTQGANYCYKIWSVNGSNQYSAGMTPVCDKTYSHNWTGDADTDWFNPLNWGPGTVPTATDGAYIPAGRPNYPLIDDDGATCYDLTIESGASVAMDGSTAYTFQVAGDWTNNGTFTPGIGTVSFAGTNTLQTIRGSSTTHFHVLQLDKGALGNILEATSLITLNAATNPLVITAGTFKLSSASTITPFTDDNFATNLSGGKGLWNNGGTINSGAFTWFLNGGLLRISAGTVNVGNSLGNSIDYLNNGTLMVEGGALNIAARFTANDPPNSTGRYIQTGGTVTVFTIGSSSTVRAPFYLSPNASFTMSGGTIVVQRQSSNTGGEVVIASNNYNVTGGTLQLGNISTPAAHIFRINSTAPLYNLMVNATNAPTARLFTNNLTVLNNVTISGGTLDANSLNLNVGGHWMNNGTFIAGTGTVTFNGTAAQNLGGSNTTTFNNLTLNNANGLSLSGSVNTTVNGVLNLTSGVISTGGNKIIVPALGSVARTSGHIFGHLQKNVTTGTGVALSFEVGDATETNYTPVEVNFASVTSAGDITAQTASGDHPQIGSAILNASKSANRYWSLTNSGVTFTTCDAVFNFLTTDLDPTANTSALICGKYDAPDWTYPTIGTRTSNSAQVTGLASFSDFQLAELPCIAPSTPTVSATVNPTCSGHPTMLSVATGNLNGAANWQWYSGTCEEDAVGSGASITVSPTSTTAYFVRGEGGCITSPGSCGDLEIVVNDQPTGPSLAVKTPNMATVCPGTDLSATFNAGSGGVGCSDDYVAVIDGGTPVVYIPGTTIGTGATSSVVIQGRRANCSSGAGCNGLTYMDLATWTVGDNTPPSTPTPCPNAQTVHLNDNCQATMPDYRAGLSATDNCSLGANITFVQSPPPGTAISGTTPVAVTIHAKDEADNLSATPCSFTVTGLTRQINIQGNGLSIVNGDNTPDLADHTNFGSHSPNVAFGRTFTVQNTGDQPLNITSITSTNTTNYTIGALSDNPIQSNQSATFTVTFMASTPGSFLTTVTVISDDCDDEMYDFDLRGTVDCSFPTFTTCPTAQSITPSSGQCSALTQYTATAAGTPLPTLTYQFSGATVGTGSGSGTGQMLENGVTQVLITAANSCGSTTCSFTVTVTDNQNPSIVCPTNISKNTDVGQCAAIVTYTVPTVSDNCPGWTLTRTAGLASGSAFPVGANMVVWQATDVGNNSAVCQFTVTVSDAQPPTIVCPANIVRSTDANLCTAVVNYAMPTANDNCGVAGIALQSAANTASGSAFSKGTTVVVWKASDTATPTANTATCQFSVTVNDTQLPTITCSGNITKGNDAGLCTAAVTYATPTVSDNCMGVMATLQSGLPSGSNFPKGQTTVVWLATDAVGLTRTCAFRVTVNDIEAPAITCPTVAPATTTANSCASASLTYATPTATDNCPGAITMTRLSGPASGSNFSAGTTTVVWRAMDAAGRSSTCSFVVTVTDDTAPTISCPGNILVTGSGSPCTAMVTYASPTAADNCNVQSVSLLSGITSGSTFPTGVTINVWRAVDNAALSATCSFTVTVGCGANSEQGGVGRAQVGVQATDNQPVLTLSLVPNPAISEVQILMENLGDAGGQLTVLDAQGRLMWRQRVEPSIVIRQSSVISLADLPAGVYFVTLRAEGQTVTKRLVVARR